jgi:hypothetical protein
VSIHRRIIFPATFRQALQRDGFGHLGEVAVGCRVYGGGPDGLFSVTLDLPEA